MNAPLCDQRGYQIFASFTIDQRKTLALFAFGKSDIFHKRTFIIYDLNNNVNQTEARLILPYNTRQLSHTMVKNPNLNDVQL